MLGIVEGFEHIRQRVALIPREIRLPVHRLGRRRQTYTVQRHYHILAALGIESDGRLECTGRPRGEGNGDRSIVVLTRHSAVDGERGA